MGDLDLEPLRAKVDMVSLLAPSRFVAFSSNKGSARYAHFEQFTPYLSSKVP